MNITGKQQPELIERPASLPVPTSTKSGIALLYNEETNNTYDVCLKLTKEVLTIQKLDVVCTSGSESQVNHRTVVLRRQATGSLGLSIKGGAEHNVPVVISKIFKDQVADQTGKLFVGDAVLQVNGINVEHCTHEEVVHLLRTAGDEVTITVRYLREVPSFLKLPLGSPGPDHSRVSSPLFDSGVHLNGNGNNTAPSPPSPSANEPKYEKRWLDAVSLPLLMARVSRYKAGKDKLRDAKTSLSPPLLSSSRGTLRIFHASRVMCLQHVLGLPQGLLTAGHARSTSHTVEGIQKAFWSDTRTTSTGSFH